MGIAPAVAGETRVAMGMLRDMKREFRHFWVPILALLLIAGVSFAYVLLTWRLPT